MGTVGEDIELAAKTTGEVVAALAEESGALAVPSEYAHYIAQRVHLRHYPKLVERAMAAAEKIHKSGLPRRAFAAIDEPLLSAILEGMAEETDPGLVEAWENLLANTLADGAASVRRDFPEKLRQLDPSDARILERWADQAAPETVLVDIHTTTVGDRDGPALNNLAALGLVDAVRHMPATTSGFYYGAGVATGYVISELGWALLLACRPPRPPD